MLNSTSSPPRAGCQRDPLIDVDIAADSHNNLNNNVTALDPSSCKANHIIELQERDAAWNLQGHWSHATLLDRAEKKGGDLLAIFFAMKLHEHAGLNGKRHAMPGKIYATLHPDWRIPTREKWPPLIRRHQPREAQGE
jgi:hypothetical protein